MIHDLEKKLFLYTRKCILGVLKLHLVKQLDPYWEPLAGKAGEKNDILYTCRCIFFDSDLTM
jgi:hypothetical protein